MTHNKWTYQKCFDVALECKTRAEFKRKYLSAYTASRKNKWLDSFNWFVDGRRARIYKWTEKLATEEAKKYKNITEFAHKALGAYKYVALDQHPCSRPRGRPASGRRPGRGADAVVLDGGQVRSAQRGGVERGLLYGLADDEG